MMKKKILIYSLISILIPLILVSVLTALIDFYNKAGFIYLGLVMLCATFFVSLESFNLKLKPLLAIALIINTIYVVITSLVFKLPCWYLFGLLTIPAAIASYYTRWAYSLFSVVSYPIVFSLYGINRYTLELYLVALILTFAYSIWTKYHKTKIYLYDNYGD